MRSILPVFFVIFCLSLSGCGTESSNACVFVEAESKVEIANGAAFTPDCEGGGEFDEARWLEENQGRTLPTDEQIQQLQDFR